MRKISLKNCETKPLPGTKGTFYFSVDMAPDFANFQGCRAPPEPRSPKEENGNVECPFCAFGCLREPSRNASEPSPTQSGVGCGPAHP